MNPYYVKIGKKIKRETRERGAFFLLRFSLILDCSLDLVCCWVSKAFSIVFMFLFYSRCSSWQYFVVFFFSFSIAKPIRFFPRIVGVSSLLAFPFFTAQDAATAVVYKSKEISEIRSPPFHWQIHFAKYLAVTISNINSVFPESETSWTLAT